MKVLTLAGISLSVALGATTAIAAPPVVAAQLPPSSTLTYSNESTRADDISSTGPPTYVTESNFGFEIDEALRGMVFLKGPVADQLGIAEPYPTAVAESDLEAVHGVETRLINSMLSADSTTLDVAVTQTMSGDPYVVQVGLRDIARSFKAALDREYPGISETSVPSARCGAIAVCAAVSVAAIALAAAIGVVVFNVAGNVNMVYNQNGLWDQNGVFNGKVAPRASSPTDLVQNYPTLAASEQVRRTTIALRGK